jgi:hypothetical protein
VCSLFPNKKVCAILSALCHDSIRCHPERSEGPHIRSLDYPNFERIFFILCEILRFAQDDAR